jgi:hypothetical protein
MIYGIRKKKEKFIPTFSSNPLFSVIRRYLGPIYVGVATPYASLRQKSRITPDTHVAIQKIYCMVNSNRGHTPNAQLGRFLIVLYVIRHTQAHNNPQQYYVILTAKYLVYER